MGRTKRKGAAPPAPQAADKNNGIADRKFTGNKGDYKAYASCEAPSKEAALPEEDGRRISTTAPLADEKKPQKEHRFRWMRFFEKPDFREEREFQRFGKKLLFGLLVIVEVLILLDQVSIAVETHRWGTLLSTFGIEIVLTVSEAVKLFAVKGFRNKIYCYVIDFVAAFILTAVTGSTYLCTLYLIILTEFYISSEKILPSVVICAVCMVVYVLTLAGFALFRQGESVSFLPLLTQSFNDLVILLVHFILVNFSVRFYRQYLRLTKALKDLDKSKEDLQKAYDDLAEVTALEERQRIAKDIHDTAGHSITTVIMQTEAAKLIIDSQPEEAKSKIIAANLQAKHALEELRESVHLLSGIPGKATLKDALEGIINESTDGTGIKIRSDIDDICVSDAKYRLLCNTLKEGISNGLRHGNATAFWFELKEADGKISFLLSDNGSGVAINQLKEGFGLTGMSGRAESLGGEVWFVSEPDEGFEIHLMLPHDSLSEQER